MAIQILGLRPVFNKAKGKEEKKEYFFSKKWRAPSVADLLARPEEYVAQIPEDERWNLYFTAFDALEERGRRLNFADNICFDIDNVDLARVEETARLAISTLGLQWDETGVIFSGNGIQFFVGIREHITSVQFFEENRPFYKAICQLIQLALDKAGLPGKVDPSVFSPARIMRMPLTLNKKPGRETRMAQVLQGRMVPVAFDLKQLSGIPQIDLEEQISPEVLKRYPDPDTKTVLRECQFLVHAKEDAAVLPEQEWYAMLSVVGRLPGGAKLAHEYSEPYPGYSRAETETKLEQALTASGPRRCSNINQMWGKCHTCKHFNKVVSPILIQGPDYIKTKNHGFHEIKHDKDGNPKPGRPVYEDLRRYFEQEHPYIVVAGSEIVYVWKGSHWEECPESFLRAFAHEHFNPKPTNSIRSEFLGAVKATNHRDARWFDESIQGRANFRNGVLDLATGTFHNHSPDYGFRHVLPYDFNPHAEAPRFRQFLDEITCNRKELADVLMEFAGYALANDACWEQKALIMVGEGSNGKSTFMDTLRNLAGSGNYSSVMLADLKNEANRYQIEGKLFNLAEETPAHSLGDSSLFKVLVGGGETTVKKLYHQPYSMRVRTKFMFACNELPRSKDTTTALYRRLLIVPFEAKFDRDSRDTGIRGKLDAELPGIFNLVLEGYKRLHAQRGFTHSEVMEAQVRDYQEDIDTVLSWKSEFVTVHAKDSDKFVPTKKLYDAYVMVTESRNERVETFKSFCKRLSKMVPDFEERSVRRRSGGGPQERGLLGVSLHDESSF